MWKRVKCKLCGHDRCMIYIDRHKPPIGFCFRNWKAFKLPDTRGEIIMPPPPGVEKILAKIEAIRTGKTRKKRKTIEWMSDYQLVDSGIELNYLKNRGIGEAIIRQYFIGTTRRYPGRVIIPEGSIHELYFYSARSVLPNNLLGGQPKYLFPKGTPKGIFNIDRAHQYKTLIICEGPFSAIAIGVNAIGLYGKTLSKYQRRLLLDLVPNKEIIVCLDGDAPQHSIKLAQTLAKEYAYVRVCLLPPGYDPADMPQSVVHTMLSHAKPFSKRTVVGWRLGGRI